MNYTPADVVQNPNHGERMIEVRVRFWTDEIDPANPAAKGAVIKRHCWDYGTVSMHKNASHDISPENDRHFHSIMDLTSVIAEVLTEHGIKLHPGSKLGKIMDV